MDPLSITASAITLIQAAGTVASTLQSFVQAMRGADAQISSLCNELTKLTGFLKAVDQTLKGCRTFDLAFLEDDLGRQSELALADCHVTLNELGNLVNKIKKTARSKGLGWRARAALDLTVHRAEIEASHDKIHKSNWALQTMLQTITVSISLRNKVSQETILFELERLKSSIDEALRASLRSNNAYSHDNGNPSNTRVSRNLRNLAEAAKHFHSAASSTAGTICDESSSRTHTNRLGALSLIGDLPEFRRQRVVDYLRDSNVVSRGQTSIPDISIRPLSIHSTSPAQQSPRDSTEVSTASVADSMEDDEDDEVEFEQLFLDGLEELTKECVQSRDYAKAAEYLEMTIKRKGDQSVVDTVLRRLRIKLCLCYFLQGRWQLAEPIVYSLAKTKDDQDPVLYNFLHAISLAYLDNYSLDPALEHCRKAHQGKKRLAKERVIDAGDYAKTLGLLASIFDLTGDFIRAEVFRRKIPSQFPYTHPRSEVEFLLRDTNILQTLFGVDPGVGPELHELDAGVGETALDSARTGCAENGSVSPLAKKLSEQLRLELDTQKEIVAVTCGFPTVWDADDEASSASSTPTTPIKDRLNRLFGSRKVHKGVPKPHNTPEDPPSLTPTSPTSPVYQWFKGAHRWHVRKPRNLLRKRLANSDKPEKIEKPHTFKLLHIEKIGNISDPAHEEPQRRALQGTSYGDDEDHSIPSHEDIIAESRCLHVIHGIPLLPELGDTNLPNLEKVEESSERGAHSAMARKAQDADVASYIARACGAHIGAIQSDRVSICTSGTPPTTIHDISRSTTSASARPALKVPVPVPIEAPRCNSAEANVERFLGQVTAIFASLSQIEDADRRHAVKFELEILSLNMHLIRNDPALCADIRRIIKSLENRQDICPDDEYNDSGYESADRDRCSSGSSSPTASPAIVSPYEARKAVLKGKVQFQEKVEEEEEEEEIGRARQPPTLSRAWSWRSDSESKASFSPVRDEEGTQGETDALPDPDEVDVSVKARIRREQQLRAKYLEYRSTLAFGG